MNNTAQTPITFIFTILTFIIGWVLFGAKFLSDAGQQYIAVNQATGLEAFFYGNLNLIVMFCLLLVIIAYSAWSTGQ